MTRKVDEARAVTVYTNGYSLKEVGRKLGVHSTTVCRALKRNGVPRRTRRGNSTIETLANKAAKAVALYKRGFSLRDVSEMMHMSKPAVCAALDAAGVPRRSAAEAQQIGISGRRVLNAAAVTDIRQRRAATGESWARLGKRYDVSEDTARLAGLGITWRHVPMITSEAGVSECLQQSA